MDRGRAQPAEGLTVISVTAALGICILHGLEQLLSVHEVWKRGGEEVEREREGKTETERRDRQSPNWKSGIYYMVETTACAGVPPPPPPPPPLLERLDSSSGSNRPSHSNR